MSLIRDGGSQNKTKWGADPPDGPREEIFIWSHSTSKYLPGYQISTY